MASKEECDKYAAELTQRFDALVEWAKENWPNRDFPLLDSDFAGSRRELGEILGPKLADGGERASDQPAEAEHPSAGVRRGDPEYVEMNPMPWP